MLALFTNLRFVKFLLGPSTFLVIPRLLRNVLDGKYLQNSLINTEVFQDNFLVPTFPDIYILLLFLNMFSVILLYMLILLSTLLQLISISLTLDFARSTAIKPGLVQCWISSTNRSAVVSPLTYDVNCFKSTILDNIFGIKQRNQATLDCSRKLRYLLLQNIWSLLQRFYFRKEDWTLRAISTQFCHFPQYFLILFLSLKSFGNSWGNVVYTRFFFFTFYLFFYTRMFFTFNINHCFPCGELKLFWNVAKLQNITSMIIWEFLICSLHFE